MLSDKRFATDF